MELARTEAAFLPCYSCCKCVMLRWSRLQSQPCVCLVSPFQNHSSLLRIWALEGEEAGSAVGERPRTGVLRVFEASLRVVHAVPTCAVLAAALPLHSLSLLQCHRCPLGARGEGALSPVPGDGAGTRKSGGERGERAHQLEAIAVLRGQGVVGDAAGGLFAAANHADLALGGRRSPGCAAGCCGGRGDAGPALPTRAPGWWQQTQRGREQPGSDPRLQAAACTVLETVNRQRARAGPPTRMSSASPPPIPAPSGSKRAGSPSWEPEQRLPQLQPSRTEAS